MADEMNRVFGVSDTGKDKKKRRIFLIASVGVLVVALGVSAALILVNNQISEERIERILEFGTLAKGVSIGGVELFGMTEQDARAATEDQAGGLMDATKISFDIDGAVTTLDTRTLGLSNDFEEIFSRAAGFARTGSFDARLADIAAAKSGGAAFTVSISADEAEVRKALAALSGTFNSEARDASYEFRPNGFLADGTQFDPGKFDGKPRDLSALVRLSAAELPNPLRYLYWKGSKYIDNSIPVDADIARFQYIEEQKGLETDMEALLGLLLDAVENADFSTITVPTNVTEPTVTLEQVKAQTQLVSSWTSWYGHSSVANRAFNVGLLASKINGLELEPGMEWSINKNVGQRTTAGGFRRAGVIDNGAYIDDVGGGVCQVSSTLFNAVLRADIQVLTHERHTIPSAYLPRALDAAISWPGPDLKIKNTHDKPVFIVAYMDYKNKTITFEVYGPTVVHETHGDVILDFTGKTTGGGGAPGTDIIYGAVTPDGTPVPPGGSVEYVKARGATYAAATIHYLDLTGKELESKLFYNTQYRAYRGKIYVNDAPPADGGGEAAAEATG